MSLNQSKVYLYADTEPLASRRNISKDLGLHRVDVYRKLRDLQRISIGIQSSKPVETSRGDARVELSSRFWNGEVLHRNNSDDTKCKERSFDRCLRARSETNLHHQSAQRVQPSFEKRCDSQIHYRNWCKQHVSARLHNLSS